MQSLQVTARFRIQDGKREDFEKIAGQCVETVRAKDTGTLQYDEFMDAAGTECVVREAYRYSDAILEHVQNLGATLGALLAVADLELEVSGSPSPQLVEATSAMAPRVFEAMQSL